MHLEKKEPGYWRNAPFVNDKNQQNLKQLGNRDYLPEQSCWQNPPRITALIVCLPVIRAHDHIGNLLLGRKRRVRRGQHDHYSYVAPLVSSPTYARDNLSSAGNPSSYTGLWHGD